MAWMVGRALTAQTRDGLIMFMRCTIAMVATNYKSTASTSGGTVGYGSGFG